MAQVATEIIMSAYERLLKLIEEGNIYTKTQLDAIITQLRIELGDNVADAVQAKIEDGSLAALQIIDGSLNTEKFANNAITTEKRKGSFGRLVQKRALEINLQTKAITCKKTISAYIDGVNTKIHNSGDTISINYTGNYLVIYVDLKDKCIKTTSIGSISNPHMIIAIIYIDAKTGYAIPTFFGNDETFILIDGTGVRRFDNQKTNNNALIIPNFSDFDNTFNITYVSDTNTLNLEFASGRTVLYGYVKGVRKTIKQVNEYALPNMGATLCYLDLADNIIKFRRIGITSSVSENKDVDEQLDTGAGIARICIVDPSTTEIRDYLGCWDTVRFNGNKSDLLKTLELNKDNFAKSSTEVDQNFAGWDIATLGAGIDTAKARIYQEVLGSIMLDGMYQVHCGDSNRQHYQSFPNGGHVFEGWSTDWLYRLTMLTLERNTSKIAGNNADGLPRSAIQVFEPSTGTFGWMKIGSDSKYDYMGGWDFTSTHAKAHTPLSFDSMDYPNKMPGKTEDGTDIAIKDGTVFRHTDGYMRYRKDGVWYKLMLEREADDLNATVKALTAIVGSSIGLTDTLIELPNGCKNTLEILSNKIYKVIKISDVTLVGTETWTVKTTGDIMQFSCDSLTMSKYCGAYSKSNVNMYCANYPCRAGAVLNDDENVALMGRGATSKGFIVTIRSTLASTVEELKTWLTSNNIKIYYELETYVNEEVTSTYSLA